MDWLVQLETDMFNRWPLQSLIHFPDLNRHNPPGDPKHETQSKASKSRHLRESRVKGPIFQSMMCGLLDKSLHVKLFHSGLAVRNGHGNFHIKLGFPNYCWKRVTLHSCRSQDLKGDVGLIYDADTTGASPGQAFHPCSR